jgi:hypothetical protein
MSHVRRALACTVVLTAMLASFAVSARATDPTVVANAITYLSASPPMIAGTTPASGSGAWDTDPAFQFATTEAVLAIAEAAQTSSTWSTSEALAAVTGTQNPQGQNPLAFLNLVEGNATTPGQAAKYLVLVAAPLGQDTTTLASTIGSPNPDGSFASDLHFTDTLFAALAKKLLDGSVPASTVAYIESKQQAAGSWAYNADTTPATEPDIDTTGLAVQALIAGGVAQNDPVIQHALSWIASQQNADGTWSFFGDESAESSSRAVLAVTAATRCSRRPRPSRSSGPTTPSPRWRTPTAASRGRTCSAPRTPPVRRCRASNDPGCRWRARPTSRARPRPSPRSPPSLRSRLRPRPRCRWL